MVSTFSQNILQNWTRLSNLLSVYCPLNFSKRYFCVASMFQSVFFDAVPKYLCTK